MAEFAFVVSSFGSRLTGFAFDFLSTVDDFDPCLADLEFDASSCLDGVWIWNDSAMRGFWVGVLSMDFGVVEAFDNVGIDGLFLKLRDSRFLVRISCIDLTLGNDLTVFLLTSCFFIASTEGLVRTDILGLPNLVAESSLLIIDTRRTDFSRLSDLRELVMVLCWKFEDIRCGLGEHLEGVDGVWGRLIRIAEAGLGGGPIELLLFIVLERRLAGEGAGET